MAYLPDGLPEPEATAEEAEFWAHCDARRLMFQRCPNCRYTVHPPLPVCPRCQCMDRDWVEAPQRAKLFSFTWAHSAAHPAMKPSLPYNIALVEFPELPGVRLVSNVIDAAPGELHVGDDVMLVWEQSAGPWRPRFRKVGP